VRPQGEEGQPQKVQHDEDEDGDEGSLDKAAGKENTGPQHSEGRGPQEGHRRATEAAEECAPTRRRAHAKGTQRARATRKEEEDYGEVDYL
jgi:hypothetical protein